MLVVPREVVQDLASACFFMAGVARSPGGHIVAVSGSFHMAVSFSTGMQRRETAHSSFCSSIGAPTSRMTDSRLGKLPTTSVHPEHVAQKWEPVLRDQTCDMKRVEGVV